MNLFWNKEKKVVPLLEVVSEQQHKDCQAWMKELGVSSMYTTHKAWEDPILVKDAPIFPVKYKMERIVEAQRQNKGITDRNKLIV